VRRIPYLATGRQNAMCRVFSPHTLLHKTHRPCRLQRAKSSFYRIDRMPSPTTHRVEDGNPCNEGVALKGPCMRSGISRAFCEIFAGNWTRICGQLTQNFKSGHALARCCLLGRGIRPPASLIFKQNGFPRSFWTK
jgi:hypothetical protein